MNATRRTILASSAVAALGGLRRPALAQSADRVLRFVPEGNLANPDPVWTTTTVARNHAAMIWDMLYARDASFRPQPQMVQGHEISDDRLRWRFTLREGLLFHDGEPVRAADCVASIKRWARRRPLGQTLLELANEMTAMDDRRFEIRLKKPFALMTNAFTDSCFVMPERIAKTDAYQQIGDYVGSGPFRFLRDEWVSGSRAAYARFDRYQPRQEPPSFLAGGKVANFDRVEWQIIPDPGTAASALQSGEVDWVQQPQVDLLPVLRSSPGVTVAVNDKVGAVAMLAVNHTQPPFDNPKLLRAILSAVDQSDFMQAATGGEASLFHIPCGIFTPGLPMATDAGMEVLTSPRDIERSRKLVAESGYKGERIVLMSPSDYPATQSLAQVATDLMKRLGLNVDYVSTDWGTLVQRRTSKEPSDKGGWNAYCTTYEGLTVADPATHIPLRGNGPAGWFGWPTSPRLEALRDRWFDAPDEEAQHAIASDMQRVAFEEVPFFPLGQIFTSTAFRDTLTGIVPASMPIFWNVRKA
ncbi:ABC transporter substrate-binding protein [Roseomonas elaeocarpi]|uniref:ABC transporter substrate-binding protein n=1 Tax=Roseomonas elaeocarpi TaxID=907779 RepID=A0ABV6JXG4_9PROT